MSKVFLFILGLALLSNGASANSIFNEKLSYDEIRLAMASSTEQTETVVKHQTICPIMGGEVDKKIYADYQGKRIYFCCSACLDSFEADPEKVMKKISLQGITLEETPKS